MSPRTADRLSTEYALLGFLAAGARHGYDIYQELSDPGGLWLVWRIKQSQLYALLARLEERGYLTATLAPQGGRPPRKLYQRTRSGREAYLAWVKAPVEHGRQFRLDLLTKLFFARREGADTVALLLEGQRLACERWLRDLQAAVDETEEGESYQRLVRQYRAGQVQAMIDWLDTCRDELTPPAVIR